MGKKKGNTERGLSRESRALWDSREDIMEISPDTFSPTETDLGNGKTFEDLQSPSGAIKMKLHLNRPSVDSDGFYGDDEYEDAGTPVTPNYAIKNKFQPVSASEKEGDLEQPSVETRKKREVVAKKKTGVVVSFKLQSGDDTHELSESNDSDIEENTSESVQSDYSTSKKAKSKLQIDETRKHLGKAGGKSKAHQELAPVRGKERHEGEVKNTRSKENMIALTSASRTRLGAILRRKRYRSFTASSYDSIQRETTDEKELRLAFDDKEWGQYSSGGAARKAVGYFGQDYLKEPSGLARKAQDTLGRCQALVKDIETSEPSAMVIKKLDILSDMICMVVDTAEFIRNTDPDGKWVDGANDVYNILGNFLGQLNTHSGLHSALKRITDSKTIASSLSKEERIVAELFLSDFEKYGVHLDHSRRSKLIELNDRINALSHSFSRTEAAISPPQQVHMLEDLLESRKKFANLLGHESYSHFYLQDKMAKTPERVMRFLNAQNETNRKAAEKELAILSSIRQRQSIIHEVTQNDRNIMFHRAKVDNCFPYPLKEYFTVGSVISGASRLFKQLYGVRFEPEPVADGEVWHKSVRKLSVIDEEAGKIGTIYMDLYKRSRNELPKLSSAAQFTIRCSRRFDDDPENILPDSHYESLDFLGVSKPKGQSHKFQLPVVVLSCNFTLPRQEHPTFLNFATVEVLLHELGHAMHSMFARTQYQHVAGTRGKLDFVEVPSIFMEFLIKSPAVASVVSRHYQTGQKLPSKAFSKWIEAYQSFAALDQQLQLFYAWLDIQYHSWQEQKRINTSDILLKAYKDFNVFPFGGDKYQQAQFGHLGGYGSVYYSYLWSREIAKHVYEGQFELLLSNPDIEDTRVLDPMRESGELLKNEVLVHGASKNPWDMNWHKFGGKRLAL